MKRKLQTAIVLGMTFLYANSFGQTANSSPENTKKEKVPSHSHFDILLNVVNTSLNYGDFNAALTDSKKTIHGVQVGASYQSVITPNFSLVSEFYFIMKGGGLKADNPLTLQQSILRLYTLETPLLARFSFGKVFINAGPSIAYNLFGTRKIEDESKALSFTKSAGNFKRWDAGIQMGGGYIFETKQKSIVMDIRYTYGVSNIAYGQEIYNRTVNIGIHISRLRKAKPTEK
ncbi:MAG: porin family protein [Ferruginibacter sp.]